MTRRRFSEKFRTYGEWLKAESRDSRYAKRIIRFHERFPNLILKELRDVRLKDQDLSTRSWDSLSSQEKRDRQLSLQILREIRTGSHLSRVTEKLGVKKDFAVKHLGKYLYKSGGKWKVTASDRIEVEMLFYERGEGQRTIITASSKDRSLIGQYFALVQKALRYNDPTVLDKFKDRTIVDAEGNVHHFETDLDRLYEIMEAQEEPEFLEIYQN
ncbi:hypothetical protein [Methanococcoides sp. AM1]|uniref:hypothetical protein n=1 Tax=Methanococcoides sp. AM1 TaxID=1201011 RepID=UPI001082629F|nr:hypothetical protein [Methanococcoides sp. AM1]